MNTLDRVANLKQHQREDILKQVLGFYDSHLKHIDSTECRALKSIIEGDISRWERVNEKMVEMKKGGKK